MSSISKTDSLVLAAQAVLNGAYLQEGAEKPLDRSKIRAGDTVKWSNGPITFKEKVFEKDGKLYVKSSIPSNPPIALSSIRLDLFKEEAIEEENKPAPRISKEITYETKHGHERVTSVSEKGEAEEVSNIKKLGGKILKVTTVTH